MPMPTDCRSYKCESMKCVPQDDPSGKVVPSADLPNNCKKAQCDGNGNIEMVADLNDKPTIRECATSSCDQQGVVHTNKSYDEPCLIQICDGMGKCVGCNDGMLNGKETDQDCGGPTACVPCADTKNCAINADCQKSDSGKDGKCKKQECNDGVQNGTETGVDCGVVAGCKACDGEQCSAGLGCMSDRCIAFQCRKNNGTVCTANFQCASNRCDNGICVKCTSNGECASGHCVNDVCKAPLAAPCNSNMECGDAGAKCTQNFVQNGRWWHMCCRCGLRRLLR